MRTDFINRDMHEQFDAFGLESYASIYRIHKRSQIRKWAAAFALVLLAILLLPWTQNIRARGSVTTLRQEQRPQEIPTVIPGKVLRWYVKEGDRVSAGDTILILTEVKDDYFDPELLKRTREQLDAKSLSVDNYRSKADAAQRQVAALREAMDLKLREIDNKIGQQVMKIRSDSMALVAAVNDLNIKTDQLRRQRAMYDSGLVSLTQLEQRNQALQDAAAKRVSTDITFRNAKQEWIRLQLERNGELQQYLEKISKAEGDRFQSLSLVQAGTGELAKLENQYSNYSIRSGLYTITAPQSGQVVKARKAGIGEILKEGDVIAEIVPVDIDFAIEMYVRPVDLPLLANGQKVRLLFDGFPAIVFSGWPQASYGTFGGEISAVESNVSPNGKFRVLIRQDKADKPWPPQLMMGTGALGIALLKDVPIWYELWRNINGFPPEYYTPQENSSPKK